MRRLVSLPYLFVDLFICRWFELLMQDAFMPQISGEDQVKALT